MNAKEIKEILKRHYAYQSYTIFIPEYTWKDLRVDALLVDTSRRWIRGFEIKTDRGDFLKDDKWTLYSEFCSSLSIVCPEGLIKKEEVRKPFGLLYIEPNKYNSNFFIPKWINRPRNFQKRESLSWMWTYLHVIETEILRLDREAEHLRNNRY